MRVHYYLDVNGNGQIQCRKCGRVICDASENYKTRVPRAGIFCDEVPGERPGRDEALTRYYEYYCPGCYTLLDVEVREEGMPPLWDIQIKV